MTFLCKYLIVLLFMFSFSIVTGATQGLLNSGVSIVSLSQFNTTLAPDISFLKVNPGINKHYSTAWRFGASFIYSTPDSSAPSHYDTLVIIPMTLSYGLFSKRIYYHRFKPYVEVMGALNYSSAPFDVFSLGYGAETGIIMHVNARMNLQISVSKLWINNMLADPLSVRCGVQMPLLIKEGRLVNHTTLIKRWVRKRDINDRTKNNIK